MPGDDVVRTGRRRLGQRRGADDPGVGPLLRKDRGLEVTDRIRLTLPRAEADVVERYGDRLKEETLALELAVGDDIDLERRP